MPVLFNASPLRLVWNTAENQSVNLRLLRLDMCFYTAILGPI